MTKKEFDEKIANLKRDLAISEMQGRYIAHEQVRLHNELAELEQQRNIALVRAATKKRLQHGAA